MPRLCRPERSISPRPVTATGRKAPVDGDARAGGAGRGAGVGGAAGHPEARAVGLDVGLAGRGEVLDGGSRYRRRSRRASRRSRGGEEQQPELGAVGQAGGLEAPVRGDRSLGEGWRLERGQREHAGPGARRGIGRRQSCRTPERQPRRPDFGRVRQHPPPEPGSSEASPAGFRKRRIPPVRRRRRPFPSGAPPSAEAVRVNRASERMASSNRPASADAAGITPVPHAALFGVFMPFTFFAFRSPPRWARSGAADSESPPLTRGAVARPFLLVTFERRKPNGSRERGFTRRRECDHRGRSSRGPGRPAAGCGGGAWPGRRVRCGAGRSARHRSAAVVSNAGRAASPSRFRSGSSTSPLPSRDRRRPRPPGSGSGGSRPLRGGVR